MTLCLTFDDGLKAHADIASPLLKARGWSGAFNIPTAFMDADSRHLTPEQIKDLCIEDHEDDLMTWDDARKLIVEGHECYPHTHDHLDLADLYKAGNLDEIERQIIMSSDAYNAAIGTWPAFYCLPHYSTCAYVNKRIRAHKMEVFNCGRANFGENYTKGEITRFIENRQKTGWRHVDISVHGISKATGGWAPFDTVEDFEGFLDEIKATEKSGLVKVVPYSVAHRKYSTFSKYEVLFDRIINRIKVWLITHLYR